MFGSMLWILTLNVIKRCVAIFIWYVFTEAALQKVFIGKGVLKITSQENKHPEV